jgi:hypothetical protein
MSSELDAPLLVLRRLRQLLTPSASTSRRRRTPPCCLATESPELLLLLHCFESCYNTPVFCFMKANAGKKCTGSLNLRLRLERSDGYGPGGSGIGGFDPPENPQRRSIAQICPRIIPLQIASSAHCTHVPLPD